MLYYHSIFQRGLCKRLHFEDTDMKKLAVFFPGIGYSMERPLLYFSRKLVEAEEWETFFLKFTNFPKGVRGDKAKMQECVRIAYEQTRQQLASVDFSVYDRVVFVAKSIGTAAAVRYAAAEVPGAFLVLYTPVEATFASGPMGQGIAFLGDRDPWSDVELVKQLAEEKGIPLYMYEGCNHSLETGDVLKDIRILEGVMGKTSSWMEKMVDDRT